jgi:hypothetical protein
VSSALGEELALEFVQLLGATRGPDDRCVQPRAAIQLGRLAAGSIPPFRGLGQVLPQFASLRVLGQPLLEPRPFPGQSLMRDLDARVVRRQQTIRRQSLHHRGEQLVTLEVELGERHAPFRQRPLLAGRDQTQKESARCRALLVVQTFVGRLREAGDGAAHTTAAPVNGESHPIVVARVPQLDECRRQKRQRARLVADLLDQRIDQRCLDSDRGSPGRKFDRASQLVRAHRTDEHLVGGEELRQLGVGAAVAVVIAANRDNHHRPLGFRGEADQPLDEGAPFRLVGAQREDLFELVDDEHQPLAVRDGENREWVLSGPHDRHLPAVASRDESCPQRRHQTSCKHGRLAATRRSDDREKARDDGSRGKLADELLAPEKECRVLLRERRQPLVGPLAVGELDRLAPGGIHTAELQADRVIRELQVRASIALLLLQEVRRGSQPSRCLLLRPLAHQLVDATRYACGRARDRLEREVVDVLARVERGDPADTFAVQGSKHAMSASVSRERSQKRSDRVGLRVAAQAEDEQRTSLELRQQHLQPRHDRGRNRVQVVQHEQRGCVGVGGFRKGRGRRRSGRSAGANVDDRAVAVMDEAREHRRQVCLPDPRRASEQERATEATSSLAPSPTEPGEIAVAPHEW